MPAIHDYGDRALLIECGCTADALALTDVLRAQHLPGVLDIVPGAQTVLVILSAPDRLAAVRARLAAMPAPRPAPAPAPGDVDVVIDVTYDGEDLPEVADALGMTTEDVVEVHTGTPWRVGFVGFAPGFAYLVDGDPRLSVPRRAEPRPRVPAGAVALAGEFSGIYPRESPGGWQLIGRTEAVLWDLLRPRPALLAPGMWVRFRSVERP